MVFNFIIKRLSTSFLIFTLTYISFGVLYLNRKPLALVKSQLQTQYNLSALGLSWLDTAFSAFHTLGLFILPVIIKQLRLHSNHLPILLCYISVSILVFCFSLCTTENHFLLFWGLQGFADAPVYSILTSFLLPYIEKESRSFIFGLWGTSQQLGSIISTFLSSIISKYFYWQALFIFPSILTLFMGFILYKLLPYNPTMASMKYTKIKYEDDQNSIEMHTPNKHAHQRTTHTLSEVESTHASTSPRSQISNSNDTFNRHAVTKSHKFLDILLLSDVIYASLAYFCIKMMRHTMLNWLPFLFMDIYNMTSQEAGFMSILFDVGSISGSVLFGLFSDYTMKGPRILMIIYSLIALAWSFLIISFFINKSHWYFLSALFCIGFFLSGPDGMLSSIVPQEISEKRDIHPDNDIIVSGIINGIGTIGTIAHGTIVVVISTYFGWNYLFLFFACLSVLSIIFLLLSYLNSHIKVTDEKLPT